VFKRQLAFKVRFAVESLTWHCLDYWAIRTGNFLDRLLGKLKRRNALQVALSEESPFFGPGWTGASPCSPGGGQKWQKLMSGWSFHLSTTWTQFLHTTATLAAYSYWHGGTRLASKGGEEGASGKPLWHSD